MRTINIWEKALQSPLFIPVYVDAAKGEQDSRYWAKNKHTGIITQFARGKRLRDYRAILERDEGSVEG